MKCYLQILVTVVVSALASREATSQEKVSFNRDVRPILASKCYACHGPDEEHQEAGLRFDMLDLAIEMEAIVPGHPEQSELIARIESDDADVVMPPPHSGESLTPKQRRTLQQWINEGATFEPHWAFGAPIKTALPVVKGKAWVRNPIDRFVLTRLESRKLIPSPEADRYSLVRRLYLDLIGMVPTIEEADRFVNSEDPNAYEKLVDELLASPRYGEKWAQPWLDLARYSDTNGYEKDRERSAWPYRDWVIRSLNEDMPYDQFSIEQIAGDMLDSPTPDQLVATGFHRNTMLNEEGGIDPLEYRFLAMVDRVATTGTVWLGLTTGCAQCHTHKYDPITHTDYYRLMALMNNADEPDFLIPDEERLEEIKVAKSKVKKMEWELESQFPIGEGDGREELLRKKNLEHELAKWIAQQKKLAVAWQIIRPAKMKTNLPVLELQSDGSIFASGDTTKRDVYSLSFQLPENHGPVHSIRLEALPDERLPDLGPGKTYYEGRKGDFFLSELSASVDGTKIEFAGAAHSFSKPNDKPFDLVFDGDGSSGWKPGANKSQRLVLVLNLKKPISKGGKLDIEMLFERHYTVSLGRFRFATSALADAKANRLPEMVESLLATESKSDWSETESNLVRHAFLLNTPLLVEQRKPIDAVRARIPKLNHCLVFQERATVNQRPTFRHHRGEYLSPKETVAPGLPELFVSGSGADQPKDRLEFANWLVSEDNPLVARVAVNRAWREFFGQGLMRTSGDFGVQSQPPSHPELLDWLAVHYRSELNWSTKSLHRLIVSSSTYRQASEIETSSLPDDVDNIWLARGPGFRLQGEVMRDLCLKATDTLSTKMYGRGVRPPQPETVTKIAYGATKWPVSKGEDRFRRSIYTFRKRTAAFAAYKVFDGPTGEVCTAKRNRSNTPLQALTVLNDAMFVEMAQALGKRIATRIDGANVNDVDAALDDAITEIFRRFLTRPPSEFELDSLVTYYRQQLSRLNSGELDAAKLNGSPAVKGKQDSSTHASSKLQNYQAAFSMVARVVMNLDETVTKR